MKISVGKKGRTLKFYLPLHRRLIKFILRVAVRVSDGDTAEKKAFFTAEEKTALIAAADEAVKFLKEYRRKNGKIVLVEVQSAEGENVRITL